MKLNRLISELGQLTAHYQTSFTSDQIYVYQGHFARLSTILSLVNNAANVIHLKSVHIHLTNALLIDVDFKINPQRYTTHSPDLIVIAPKVKFAQATHIDLSCYVQMGYPNGQQKAANGEGYGASGHDGLPGLPGFNGGQFLLFAEDVVGADKMTFKSKGGKGGPGQNGKNIY